MRSDELGNAGTPEPTTEREPPETDPEGSSGAEEGLNPPDPEGPTTST